MKIIKILIMSMTLMTVLSSCTTTKPGEYSSLKAGLYGDVDVPVNEAWSKAFKILSKKGTITSDDQVLKKMTVVLYERPVKVSMAPLNATTTRVKVSSRHYLISQEASARVIFHELIDGLK